MFIKRITYLTVVFLVACGSLYAQSSLPIPYTYLNNLVQPAPNAAALGKYADYPVSYMTGVPQVGVPLHTIKDGSINIPISLSYHASGIRVSEVATWVGLGWALNAGGMIIRTVRGSPDEGTRKVSSQGGPKGYYRDHGLSTLPSLPYPDPTTGMTSDPTNSFVNNTAFAMNAGSFDTEPDLYTFNFNGHVGRFVFDENQVPRLLEDDNLKISVNYNTSNTPSPFVSWMITTEDGVQYFFGENKKFEVNTPISSTGTIDPDSAAPSGWMLTRIYNPNTNETATFNYTSEVYAYRDLGQEGKVTPLPPMYSQACDNSGIATNLIATTVSGWRLTSIQTANYSVQFLANTLRQDLIPGAYYPNVGTFTAYQLDAVKVFNNASQCIKQFTLNHSYFTSTTATATNVSAILSAQYGSDATDSKRLKLTSITESSGDGSVQKPPYVFTYNESLQLPRRLSYDQDDLGYSNNSAGNNNQLFSPLVYDGSCIAGGGTGGGAIRTSRWPDMSAFTLSNIQDPLGANTVFVFEANYADNLTTTVGGLRVKQINVTDNVTGTVQVKSYDYQSSGNLLNSPAYLLDVNNEYFFNLPTAGYRGYSTTSQSLVAIIKQSQSIVPLQDAQGNHIVYSTVKETLGASGEGGYTLRHFDIGLSPHDLSSKIDMAAYTAQGTMNGVPGLYGNSHFNDFTTYPGVAPINLSYYYGFNTLYPFSPQQIDLNKGKLLYEEIHNATGGLIERTDNTFTTTLHEDALIRGVKCFTITTGSGGTSTSWYGLNYYKLHTGISHLTSTVKTSYNPTGNVLATTTYSYDSPNHTLKTGETTINSNGDVLVNKIYYSFDYANTATSDNVFSKMKTLNLLAPVHMQSWKNGNLIDGKVTVFHDFATGGGGNTFISPINIYSLETATALTPAQSGESTTWTSPVETLVPGSYYQQKVSFTFDGSTNSLISQQLTNNKSQGMQWSAGLKLPVALVDNAVNTPALKEFYYEGFEESTASGLNVTTAHTGTTSINSPYTVSWTLPNSRSYVISYWYLSGGVWKFKKEQAFTGSLTLSGGTAYDDIRICPADAQMTSYTYNATGNLTSSIDPKGLTNYYEYDSFQKLVNIKDKDGNIVKHIDYHYQGL